MTGPSRQRSGHLVLTLRGGEARTHVPVYLDCLVGAGRTVERLDGGRLDRSLRRWAGGFRAMGVYHARRSIGRVGEQGARFDEVEEALGLSRTYAIQLAEPGRTDDAVAALRDLDLVEAVAPELLATTPRVATAPERPLSRAAAWWPHERVRAPEAHRREAGDERVPVAVLDTGVALGHAEFRRKLLAGYDCVDLGLGRIADDVMLVGDSRGLDYEPSDDVNHGTHVAGVLGAQGRQVPRGIAGRSLLLPIRVLAAALVDGERKLSGVGAHTQINEGVKIACELGARVMNLSFGTPESVVDPDGPLPHASVISYAAENGCILVAASGNSGLAERYYPAALPEVIAVGSVDEAGRRSEFSTFGAHLALCAPGEDVISAGRHGYRRSTGTSHAAPFVAGAAALLAARAERAGCELTGPWARALLTASAAPLPGTGRSAETGYGLLDVAAALDRLDAELEGRRAGPNMEERR